MSNMLHPRNIRTPGELRALLKEIKQAVAQGLLEQIRPDPSPFATDEVITGIPDEGPWPDYLELQFWVPSLKKRYRFSVETYHGSGESWGPEK